MTSAGPRLLQVQDLSIALPAGSQRSAALHRVSLSVGRGEIVCLLGDAGAGKSVLAQGVMGLLPPGLAVTGGCIALLGEDLTQAPPAQLRKLRGAQMAMVFEDATGALNPVMRCGRQIDEVLRVHSRLAATERQAKVLAVAREVQLPDPERLLSSRPHQLSDSERQRVALAMALVLDPPLLIADAPTAALGTLAQSQFLQLLLFLAQRRSIGVLFMTRDAGVAAEVAQRVAVLHAGELVEASSKAAVLHHPEHEATRHLLRAVPAPTPRPRLPEVVRPPDAALRVKGLCKTFGKQAVPAVQDVSFEIRRGQTLSLVGESGSGKSTVARCIARLMAPDSGSVLLGTDDIAALSAAALRPQRRRVQMVAANPGRALNPLRTVGQSLVEGPVNYGLHPDDAYRRARDLLALVGMDRGALERAPQQFSDSDQQRICIARALMLEPEVLICDEAVAEFDLSQQARLLSLLDALRERMNLALLFITHDLRAAAHMADQLVVMHAGRVLEAGPAQQVLFAPQHAATRELLAAVAGRGFAFAR